MKKLIKISNPWTGELVTQDVTDLTETELEAFAEIMNDDLREELHNELAPCTPGEFLAAWCARVSREEAGRVILGG